MLRMEGASLLAERSGEQLDERRAAQVSKAESRPNRGFHSILEQDHPYIFIDSCMQIWPDADFANAHRHGVTGYAVTAWRPLADVDGALGGCMYWHLLARLHPNIVVAVRAEDIRQAKEQGKAALIIAAQGGDWIGYKLHRIEAFQRLGLRMVLLAYNRTNHLCDGLIDRTKSGLTRFGHKVVEECNRVGVLLDCTHTGRRATLEIMERSEHPCVFSHSNPSAVARSVRNIDDEQIKACTERGGVIGLAPWGPAVMRPGTQHWPTLDEFVDMIDYVVQLSGSADHVGIGTDMSLGSYPDHSRDPWGEPDYIGYTKDYDHHVTSNLRSPKRALDGFCEYPQVLNLVDRLLDRGYGDRDVAKVLGENYLRVFEQVWG